MNVSASPIPAAACAPTAAARDGGTDTTDAAGSGGLDAFIALLTQVTPAVTAVAGQPVPAPVVDTESDAEDVADAVDWALPFLTPPGAPPATPLDLELPDPSGGAPEPTVSLLNGTVAKQPEGADVLLEAAVAGLEPDAAELEPTPTPSAATAPAVTIRADAAAATHAVTRTVHVPVGDSRWPEQVGHEVRLLVERGVQAATLRVSPEHLGPVEVRIDIVNDKANVVFGAAQAETRAALADALPRLREMFAGSGLALGDTGVRQDTPGNFAEPSPPRGGRHGDFGSDDADPAAVVPGIAAQVGLVDAYA